MDPRPNNSIVRSWWFVAHTAKKKLPIHPMDRTVHGQGLKDYEHKVAQSEQRLLSNLARNHGFSLVPISS